MNYAHPSAAIRRFASLRVLIPLGMAMFVVLGSFSLLLVFERHRVAEDQRAFAELARINADFIHRTRIPESVDMASRLSEIIGAQVYFRHSKVGRVISPKGMTLPVQATRMSMNGEVQILPGGKVMVGVEGEQGTQVIFIRDGLVHGMAMVSHDAWLALGVFWVLSLGLGFGLSRWLTRPLHDMVNALPHVGADQPLKGLPLSRSDEIGVLARTLKQTHESLVQERELRRQAERHAILGRMTASMAHEIRNPASAIRLHAQLMDLGSADEFAESKRLILSEAERLEGMVGQWMNYAKPEPPDLQEVELTSLVRDAVQIIEPQAKHMDVKLDVSFTGTSVILADRLRLRQVLGNILLNAIQAMPAGGMVTVRVVDAGQMARVTVSDEGAGFSDQAIQRLGEPFYSEKEGGMGLGLAVAMEICRAHGGLLTAENMDSGGACIRIELMKAAVHDASDS